MTKAGGSQAYGRFSKEKIKSKSLAKFFTALLGAIICFDGYFSTIATGTVMKPVTDSFQISREKLAYIVDSLGASMCVIQPISTWTAVVISVITEEGSTNGMNNFLRTIPYNFYAILSIITVLFYCFTEYDFGPMKTYEREARNSEIENSNQLISALRSNDELSKIIPSEKGKIWDLIIPLLFLIVFTIIIIVFTGGGFTVKGKSVEFVLRDSDASLSFSVSATLTIALCFLMYVPRKLMNKKEFMDGIYEGMKLMLPIVVILTLAWGVGGITKIFQTGEYIGNAIRNGNFPSSLLPFLVFIISALLAFSIGTSWGTFTILLPIINNICRTSSPSLLSASQAAVLSGAVFGDHCSPISDTTVLSSISSGCLHIRHVNSQIPYALLSAFTASIGFLMSGLLNGRAEIALPVTVGLHILVLFGLSMLYNKSCFERFKKVGKDNVSRQIDVITPI